MRRSLLVEDDRDEMGMPRYHPMLATRGPSSYGAKVSAPPTGVPPCRCGWCPGEEKLFVDSDCIGIPCPGGTSRR